MNKNSIFVYFLLPFLGGAAGYTFALNTIPPTIEDSPASQASSTEPAPSALESGTSIASSPRNGAYGDDGFPPRQEKSDSCETEQLTDTSARITPAVDPPAASPPEYEQHPSAAAQADPDARIALVQLMPVQDNLDTLTHLLLEDPVPDVRRTVLEKLGNEETANDVSIINTLDAVLRNEPDASVIRAALDYYKKIGEQYAYNACLALIQRDDLSAFALGQAYSFLVDNELIGQGDASNYVMQSPSFAMLDSDEKNYMLNDVLAQPESVYEPQEPAE